MTYKVEGLWEVTGHESEILFAVDLLLHGVPLCLLSSDSQPLNLGFPASRMMRKHISIPSSLSRTRYRGSTDGGNLDLISSVEAMRK